jgi:hypothetical protein
LAARIPLVVPACFLSALDGERRMGDEGRMINDEIDEMDDCVFTEQR